MTATRTGHTTDRGNGAHGSDGAVVLETRGITKVYGEGEAAVHALRGVDFVLRESEFLVLLGASGSGKSTLMNIIGGLDRPTDGEVLFRGDDLSAADDGALTEFRRNHVGFVFQFYNLMPGLTARENVALVTEIAGDPMTPEETLELLGLGHRLDHFPSQLSGGEQQRVAIARAIAKRPEILLCDEPTGALDFRSGIIVLDAIERINQELGTTTAVITHNEPISAMADRVVTLADGQISEEHRNTEKTPGREIRW